MQTDVSFTQSAENRIGDRVRERIAVGMPLAPELEWNRHAAENERPCCYQSMRIAANANA
jgi:hypothetical protein